MSTNISEIVDSAQGGAAVDNLADHFGLSPEQTKSAVYALIPALSAGLQKAAADPKTLGSVIESLRSDKHYLAAFEKPEAATSDAVVEQGRVALDGLFGSPAAAGKIAQVAARESGIRPDIMNRLMPVLAAIVLGGLFDSLNKQGLAQILEEIAGGGGLDAVLEKLSRREAPQPEPPRAGGLGAFIGGLLALFGKRSPASSYGSSAPRASQMGLDKASLDAAIERITKTFQPGAAQPSVDQQIGLQDILGRAPSG
jgi:hypothetical protein